jgi:hypothetical protein
MYPRLAKERTINYLLIGKLLLLGTGVFLLGLLIRSHIEPLVSGPEILSLSHKDGLVTDENFITLEGKVLRAEKVWVNHHTTEALYQESFRAQIALLPGENFIHIKAVDRFQNKLDEIITIYSNQTNSEDFTPSST